MIGSHHITHYHILHHITYYRTVLFWSKQLYITYLTEAMPCAHSPVPLPLFIYFAVTVQLFIQEL